MLVTELKTQSLPKMVHGRGTRVDFPGIHNSLRKCAEQMLDRYREKQKSNQRVMVKTQAAQALLHTLGKTPEDHTDARVVISNALQRHAEVLQGHEHLLSTKGNNYMLMEQTRDLRQALGDATASLLHYHDLKSRLLGHCSPLNYKQKKIILDLAEKKSLTMRTLEILVVHPDITLKDLMAVNEASLLQPDLCAALFKHADKTLPSMILSITALLTLHKAGLLKTALCESVINHKKPDEAAEAVVELNQHKPLNKPVNRSAVIKHKKPLRALMGIVHLHSQDLLTDRNRNLILTQEDPFIAAIGLEEKCLSDHSSTMERMEQLFRNLSTALAKNNDSADNDKVTFYGSQFTSIRNIQRIQKSADYINPQIWKDLKELCDFCNIAPPEREVKKSALRTLLAECDINLGKRKMRNPYSASVKPGATAQFQSYPTPPKQTLVTGQRPNTGDFSLARMEQLLGETSVVVADSGFSGDEIVTFYRGATSEEDIVLKQLKELCDFCHLEPPGRKIKKSELDALLETFDLTLSKMRNPGVPDITQDTAVVQAQSHPTPARQFPVTEQGQNRTEDSSLTRMEQLVTRISIEVENSKFLGYDIVHFCETGILWANLKELCNFCHLGPPANKTKKSELDALLAKCSLTLNKMRNPDLPDITRDTTVQPRKIYPTLPIPTLETVQRLNETEHHPLMEMGRMEQMEQLFAEISVAVALTAVSSGFSDEDIVTFYGDRITSVKNIPNIRNSADYKNPQIWRKLIELCDFCHLEIPERKIEKSGLNKLLRECNLIMKKMHAQNSTSVRPATKAQPNTQSTLPRQPPKTWSTDKIQPDPKSWSKQGVKINELFVEAFYPEANNKNPAVVEAVVAELGERDRSGLLPEDHNGIRAIIKGLFQDIERIHPTESGIEREQQPAYNPEFELDLPPAYNPEFELDLPPPYDANGIM